MRADLIAISESRRAKAVEHVKSTSKWLVVMKFRQQGLEVELGQERVAEYKGLKSSATAMDDALAVHVGNCGSDFADHR